MTLEEELEIACLDEMRGDPPGPSMAKRLERAVMVVLRRRRIRGARVQCTSGPRGTHLTLLLPVDGQRVRQVVLTLGQGD